MKVVLLVFPLVGAIPNYGTYGYVGNYGAFWSSTEDGSGSAWYRDLGFHYSSVMRTGYDKHFGFSIRCKRLTNPLFNQNRPL